MTRRRRNPVDWKRQADWFEAEGGKRRPPRRGEIVNPLATVYQDIGRIDVVRTLCQELERAGFKTRQLTIDKIARCEIARAEDQRVFIEQTKPHYLANQTRQWADQYLKELERREAEPRGRPRIKPKLTI